MRRFLGGLAAVVLIVLCCILPAWAEPTTSTAPASDTTLPVTSSKTEQDTGENPLPTEPTSEEPPETDEFGQTVDPPPSIITEEPISTETTTAAQTSMTTTAAATTTAVTTNSGPTYRRPSFEGERAPNRDIPDFYNVVTTPDGETITVTQDDVQGDIEGTDEEAYRRTRTLVTIGAVAGILLALAAIILLVRRRPPEEERIPAADQDTAELPPIVPVVSEESQIETEATAEAEPAAQKELDEDLASVSEAPAAEPETEEPGSEQEPGEAGSALLPGSFEEDLEKLDSLKDYDPDAPKEEESAAAEATPKEKPLKNPWTLEEQEKNEDSE